MSFWKSLFRAKADAPPEATNPDASSGLGLEDNFIDIASRKFYGQSRRSLNGRYTIAWMDGGPDQSRRERWLFLDGQNVVADGAMPRPNDGKVADNGVFILNDWGAIETLSGILKAFRPDGSLLFSRKFKANLLNNGLSNDGRWAACQTANSSDDDSGKLFIFDVAAATEIASWAPESGWANGYRFSADGQTITLIYPDGAGYRYTIAGEFLDRSLWLSAGLQNGDIYIVHRLLAGAGDNPAPELVQLLLPAIDKAMGTFHPVQGTLRAFALRLRGQCLEAIAEPAKALAAYDEALALDPKAGVKCKAAQLRKIVPE